MRLHHLRLNPDKCAFGVESENFLGFLVSRRGIEMASDQSKAIMQMPPLETKKKIQDLTGKLVALNRFISRYSYHIWLFFTALKGASSGGWVPESDKAFNSIKEYLASLLTLSQPIAGEDLYLYLIALATVVSTTLVRLDRGSKQRLVYFVSKMFTNGETRYIDFEQIALDLRVVGKKTTPLLPSLHNNCPHKLSDQSHTPQTGQGGS